MPFLQIRRTATFSSFLTIEHRIVTNEKEVSIFLPVQLDKENSFPTLSIHILVDLLLLYTSCLLLTFFKY